MTEKLCVLLIDSPDQDEMAARFLEGKTRGGKWRDLPFRTALGPLDIYSDEDREELEWQKDDAVIRDHAEKEMKRSIDGFNQLFAMWPRTGVLFRPSSPEPVTPMYGDSKAPPDELLTAIGKELYESEEHYPESFALVVLDWDDPYEYELEDEDEGNPEDRPIEHLAAPWNEIIGGKLPRSQTARRKRCEELCRRNRELRDLVERWERLSRTPDGLFGRRSRR